MEDKKEKLSYPKDTSALEGNQFKIDLVNINHN